ncbi:hypothetical protein A5881_000228 [Enterococcus termitis]
MKNKFQDIKIDWSKTKIEYKFTEFKDMNDKKLSHYLYQLPLKQTLEWICTVSENKQETNKIFSIIGDRGTGKSSFLQTISDAIKKKKHLSDKKPELYILDQIDPTLFDSSLTLIELFVSILNQEITKNDGKNMLNDNCFEKRTQFSSTLREVIEVLKNYKIEDSKFAEKNSSIELLDDIEERQNFIAKIAQLIEAFLQIKNTESDGNLTYSHIVIQIDDLDLVSNEKIFKMLNEVTKFLANQKQLIIFLAYREEQLINSLIDSLIKENETLLQRKYITDEEIKEQAAKFIEKSFPRSQRVYLRINNRSSIKQILAPFIDEQQEGQLELLLNKDEQLDEFIKTHIQLNTRLMMEPIDRFELTSFVYPNSLRSTLQYLELIYHFTDYEELLSYYTIPEKTTLSSEGVVQTTEILRKNVKRYKYFLLSLFIEQLSNSEYEILDEWLNRSYNSRNSYICTKLGRILFDNMDSVWTDFNPKTIRTIIDKQVYNVSLGDVFTIFEYYKRLMKSSEKSIHFIYAMKLLYSIELLLTFSKATINYYKIDESVREGINDIDGLYKIIGLSNYNYLAQGKIMPDGMFYNNELISGDLSKVVYYKKNMDPKLMGKIVYSDITANGDIRRTSQKREQDFGVRNFNYQYRYFFKKEDFTENNQYLTDPYSFLSDFYYLDEVLGSFTDNVAPPMYFFYSMFDMDIFVRKNYSKQNEANLVRYGLKRLNEIFTSELTIIEERSIRQGFSIPLFKIGSKIFREPYSTKEIDSISAEYLKEVGTNKLSNSLITLDIDSIDSRGRTKKVKDF